MLLKQIKLSLSFPRKRKSRGKKFAKTLKNSLDPRLRGDDSLMITLHIRNYSAIVFSIPLP